MRFETLQTMAGYTPEPSAKAFVSPLYMTAGYAYDSAQDAQEIFGLEKAGAKLIDSFKPESGISGGLERVSAGLEHIDDLFADFEQAL